MHLWKLVLLMLVLCYPHVAINAAFAQTGNVATGINSWSVANQNGKPIYTVEFHDAQNKPVSIVLDAKTGMAVK